MKYDKNNSILILADFTNYGGTALFCINLCKLARKNNASVNLIITSPLELLDFPDEKRNELLSYCDKVTYWPSSLAASVQTPSHILNKLKLNILFRTLWLLWVQLTNKYDLFVITLGTPGIFLSAGFYKPSKVVLFFHTYPHSSGNANRFKQSIIKLRAIVVEKFIHSGMRIFTVSKYASKKIAENWINNKSGKVSYIYNFAPDKFSLTTPKYTNESKLIITSGHVEWYKGPDIWINVAKKILKNHPDVSFLWLGDGSQLESYRAQIPVNFKEKIKLVGYSDQIFDYLSKGNIYFQPSKVENHSIAVLEAMSMSLPCIVSNAGGMPESVLNNETGFVIPIEDLDMYENKINYLLDNPDICKSMGMSGRKRFEDHFTYEIWEKKIVSMLFDNLTLN